MRTYPRRRLLQAVGVLTVGSMAGCTAGDDSGPASEATTTEPSPAETTTTEQTITEQSTTATDDIVSEAWTVDSLDGKVRGLWLPNRPRQPNTTGGPLYAGTTAGTVANLSVATGEVRWRFSVLGDLTPNGFPTVYEAGGGLLIRSHTWNEETLRNYVERLNPETGEREWTFEEREFLTPLGMVDDALYLAGEYIKAPPSELGPEQDPGGEGRLHAVEIETGEERWRTTVPSLVNATVARHGIYANVAFDDDSGGHTLVAFDRDGTERWRTEAGLYHLPEPVTVDDGVVASVRGGAVASFAPDGTERWRVSAWDRGLSQIKVSPERIYVGSDPLVAISEAGDERWRIEDYGSIVEPIRDYTREKTLYFAGGTRVGAIDASAGTVRWSFAPEDEKYVHARAVVEDGLLVDSGIGPDSEFVLLDEMTGDVLGSFRTETAYHSAIAVASRLFAGANGAIYALNVEP